MSEWFFGFAEIIRPVYLCVCRIESIALHRNVLPHCIRLFSMKIRLECMWSGIVRHCAALCKTDPYLGECESLLIAGEYLNLFEIF